MRPAQTLPAAFPRHEFRPLTGAVEIGVAEIAAGGGPRAERVTALLAEVFAAVDGEPSAPPLLRRLASGAREWLLHRAAGAFLAESGWFQTRCAACGEPIDVAARLAEAPVKPAGPGFPVVEVATSLGPRRFEAPNGGHEEQAARRGRAGPRDFVAACGLAEAAEDEARRFDAADLARIEAALDEAAPEVADRLTAVCPECGAGTEARLDPLAFAFPRPEALLGEVHLLARGYGWPEDAILALPSARRRGYARMIAAEAARRWPS